MQRTETLVYKEIRRTRWVLRRRNVTLAQYSDGAGETSRLLYVVRMRNIAAAESDDWATFVKRERAAARVTQRQLALAAGVARETIWRWEAGRQQPENIETVLRVAERLGVDRDIALAAARLHPGQAPAPDARLRGLDPNDPVIRHILSLTDISEEEKVKMIDRRREILARRNQQDIEDIEFYRQRSREA